MDWTDELREKIKKNNFDIGSSYWVNVTHINNPHNFYVRPRDYDIYLPTLRAHEKLIDASELKLRTIVIYKSEIMKRFIRGQIFFIEGQDGEIKCDIYASDDGCFDKSVPLKDICKPLYNSDIPPLAIQCQLADCKPNSDTWNTKAIDAMKCYVGTEPAKMEIRGKAPNTLIVVLKNSCPDDIATLLALTDYTTLGYSNNIVNRFSTPIPENHYYKYKTLHVGDILRVRVQSGNSLKDFYVAQMNDYRKYLQERDNFKYFCMTQRKLYAEELKEKKPVAVSTSDYKKERGIIKEITVPQSKARVQLVDWGTEMEVDISQLKPMTQYYLLNPAVAIYCSADESQVWDNELHQYLIPGYELFISIIEIGNNFESPTIVKIQPIKD